jgi:PAS domain S-box-containing protein
MLDGGWTQQPLIPKAPMPNQPTAGPASMRWRAAYRRPHTFVAGRLLVIFAPILALLATTALIVAMAWFVTPYRPTLFVLAGVTWTMAGLLAMGLLYRQIQHRQAANRDLRSIEARVSDIVESAMDPVVVVDRAQRIILFNAAAERAFRWPRAAVLGQPLDLLIPEQSRAVHHTHIERFGEAGATSRTMGGAAVLKALRADGSEFPIEASISQHAEFGNKIFTVILRDVSERVRTEMLLARSEARFRGILDSAMDAIITVDENQHIVLFNAAAEVMFDCARAEAVGAPLAQFIPERFRGAHDEHVRRFGQTGTVSRRMGGLRVVTGLRRNGVEFPIDASISQLDDSTTKFYTVILRDVTERARTEADLLRSKDELRKLGSAAHMALEQEKGRVSRELHDELGQALTMLQMDVVWCRDKLPPEYEALTQNLDRMEMLLKSTVAATRRIAADLRPLMLDDLGALPAVEWLVQNFIQRTGISCKLTVPGLQAPLQGARATTVFRIVQESLANIAKHAHASRAEVSIGDDGGTLTVSVRDDGCGFSPQGVRKPNAFGLLGMRERASLLNGEATITSVPGKGTRIDVRLPSDSEGIAK